VVFDSALIAANSCFQPVTRRIDARISISAFTTRFDRQATAKAHGARCSEKSALSFKPDVAVRFAIQILLENGANLVAGISLIGIARVEVFTCDLDGHEIAWALFFMAQA
jgi:hypothetical protein